MSDEIEQQIKEALAFEGIDATEAVDKSNKEEKQEAITIPDDREYTELEKEQLQKGWDPNGVKSAEEFARAEPLFEKIKAQSKELKQMRKAVDELKALSQKQEEAAFKKAYEALRKEKEDAILRGDVQAVMEVEKKQQDFNKPQVHPSVTSFLEKYDNIFKSTTYEEMKIAEFANRRDQELMTRGLSPEEHMKVVEEHMIKEFPSYFGNNKEIIRSGSSVESGTGSNVARSGSKRQFTFNDLTDEQKSVAKNFERLGVMKTTEYIKSLVDLGELK